MLVCAAAPLRLQAQKDGLWPKFGGTPPSSGFALGIGFRKSRMADGLFDFHGDIVGSIKKYEHAELHLDLPRLWKERLFIEFSSQYGNYPQEDFWGLGPSSIENRRTNFRQEHADFSGTVGFRPLRRLRVGATGGLLQINTGPGKDKSFPSIEQLFTADAVPALGQQPDYYHLGAFLQFDYRDNPLNPKSGGYYLLRGTHYGDRDFAAFSFRRYEIDVRQFFPGFLKATTIALRALTWLSDTRPGQQEPFFMQPTVGGSNDLRGFHQYRFRDRNRFVVNAEYRWETASFLDLVAFVDGGRVFSRPSSFGLRDMRGSLGGGARIKFRGRVFIGLDLGYSSEGVRLWVRRSHMF